jgi:hypothetical protein
LSSGSALAAGEAPATNYSVLRNYQLQSPDAPKWSDELLVLVLEVFGERGETKRCSSL